MHRQFARQRVQVCLSWVKPQVDIFAETGDGFVRLLFRDNGIGIARENLTSVLEIFKRASPDHEGTGIGLSIVKKAVERMGGTVDVESELGRGSLFSLKLRGPRRVAVADKTFGHGATMPPSSSKRAAVSEHLLLSRKNRMKDTRRIYIRLLSPPSGRTVVHEASIPLIKESVEVFRRRQLTSYLDPICGN